MKQFFDYLPVIAFFGAYFISGRDIYTATWAILIGCLIQVSAGWFIWRKLEKMHWFVFLLTAVFGGMTLLLRDDTFIKWRPTIINFLFAGVLLAGHFLRRNLLQRLLEALMLRGLGHIIALQALQWRILNLVFVGYFLFVGVLNLYIAFSFSTDFWVLFKAIGFSILSVFFYGGVLFYLYRCMSPEEREKLFEDKQPASANAPENQQKEAE
ncbi:MAG: septation protein IspZ [Alcanivoracaceae bacterium]|nr:septation protein IspZ [Alcanivoracaceae bacterium]